MDQSDGSRTKDKGQIGNYAVSCLHNETDGKHYHKAVLFETREELTKQTLTQLQEKWNRENILGISERNDNVGSCYMKTYDVLES